MTFLSGSPRRIGYATSRNARLYNIRVPDTRVVWGKESLCTPWNINWRCSNTSAVRSIRCLRYGCLCSRKRFRDLRPFSNARGHGFPFVLIHPAAAFATKQWPADRFAELITRIAAHACRGRVDGRTRRGAPSGTDSHDGSGRRRDSAARADSRFQRPGVSVQALCRQRPRRDAHSRRARKADCGCFRLVGFSCLASLGGQVRVDSIRSSVHPMPRLSVPDQFPEPRCIQSIDVDRVFAAVSRLLCE